MATFGYQNQPGNRETCRKGNSTYLAQFELLLGFLGHPSM